MNAALHGTAALTSVVLLLAATTVACSSDFESDGASNGPSGNGAASAGGSIADAGESGGGVVSGGGSGGGSSGSGAAGGSVTTGGSSSGGSPSGMGGDGSDQPEPCPERGSPMVRLPAEAGGFCIDAHETTRTEYAEFLANLDQLAEPALPEACQENPSYEPSEGQNDVDMDLPVVGVDYCDAYAYCLWAGKRLCGAIGGGATDYDAFNDATESQWQAACSRGGTRVFPYGNNYDPTLCNGADYSADSDSKIAVGSSQCEGGYEGIFDMSGNVWEWEDACQEVTLVDGQPPVVVCRLRGGEFSNPEGFLRCDYPGFSAQRDFATNSIGIRCCGQ